MEPGTVTVSLEDAKAFRLQIERYVGVMRMANESPAVKIADAILKSYGLNFEAGQFVPEGNYLDWLHVRIVPNGHYICPLNGQIVAVPEGKTYNRKTATLS